MCNLTIPGRIIAAIGATTLLLLATACNTTAGAGKDISATGHAITRGANDAMP